jgi:alginate O-acetyltransferase complex protein AlgJ
MATKKIIDSGKMAPAAQRPGQGGPTDPSHDVNLRRGIILTEISREVAQGMVVLFLLLIFAIPISQFFLEKVRGEESMLLDVFRRTPTRESLKQFEDDLDKASYAKDYTQPRMQTLLTGMGRVGNKKAVVGHDGWLYYKPGITFLGGPGFLDPDIMGVRIKASLDDGDVPVHPDPRPAIFAFHQALAKRGIKLVLFPVPDKTMMQPLQLHRRGNPTKPLPVPRALDWDRFVGELRAGGVAVFDPTPAVLEPGAQHYLVQDTHWTPEWMAVVAQQLATFATETGGLTPPATPLPLKSVPQEVQRVGDVVDMLKLREGQTLFAPQAVTVQQVQDAAGKPWESDPKGDVLLLGDSFTNVFTFDAMGWGAAAGLGPHLALALRRPVDVIAQNDSGAFATRQALARELGSGEDRLAGKKVVIWEFASRELAVGDWKPVEWTTSK